MGPHSLGVLSAALALVGVAGAVDVYTPPPCTTVYTPPAYTPSGYSSAYTPPPYTTTIIPDPFTPSYYSQGYTSVYTPPPHSQVYTPPPYTPSGYSTAVTPTPYTVTYTPQAYSSVYTSAAYYTSVYTPQPYTSTYTPPPYTPSGSSSLYYPPAYTSVYTPPPHTSVYTPSPVPPSYTSVYSPVPYTSVYSPPPYTPSGSSTLYTPSAYTTVYTPPAYTTAYVPPGYTSNYSSSSVSPTYSSSSVSPTYTSSSVSPTYTSSSVSPTYSSSSVSPTYSSSSVSPTYSSSSVSPTYSSSSVSPTYSSSSVSPTYSSSSVSPTYSSSSVYTPPPASYVTPPFTSVAYPTYYAPSSTSNFVPPTYTPGPGETTYATETDQPTYTPANPYTSGTSVTIVGGTPTPTPGNFTPVVGAPGLQLRLPIDQLQSQYPDVWNMYCIALEAMMAVDESLDLSYYQISGIHGAPHIPWQYPVSSAQDSTRGYCTHGSALFATWHRPYLLLIEQTLCDHAVQEAKKFTGPDAQRYQDAANKVRLPYWDWSSQSTMSHLPAVVMSETLSVVKPAPGTGAPTQVTITNPLFSYQFLRDDYRQTYFSPGFFSDTNSTRRQPDGSGVSRNSLADNQMSNTYSSRRQNTFNLFSIPTFQGFSSNSWDGGSAPNAWTSIESIHNDIHGELGGSLGHMSYVDYSAFDPIFWLHHCNVDRLTAMYQAIWPGNDIVPQQASGTFARKVVTGDMDDLNTPLYPFRHPSGVEWTSKDVSDAQGIYTYGYAYPEVPIEYQGQSSDSLRAFTIGKINDLYQPALQQSKPAPPLVPPPATPTTSSTPSSAPSSSPSGSSIRTEWVAHMAFDESEIPGDFQALIFTGDVPLNVKDWTTAPALVGKCATFGASRMTMEHVIQGSVPLTQALIDAKIGLDAVNAVKYLRDNCHWVIQQGGYSVPLSKLKSLKVGISSTDVQYFDDKTQLAKWGQAYTHYDITDGRPGGLQYNETYLVQSNQAPPVLSNSTTTARLRARSRPYRL